MKKSFFNILMCCFFCLSTRVFAVGSPSSSSSSTSSVGLFRREIDLNPPPVLGSENKEGYSMETRHTSPLHSEVAAVHPPSIPPPRELQVESSHPLSTPVETPDRFEASSPSPAHHEGGAGNVLVSHPLQDLHPGNSGSAVHFSPHRSSSSQSVEAAFGGEPIQYAGKAESQESGMQDYEQINKPLLDDMKKRVDRFMNPPISQSPSEKSQALDELQSLVLANGQEFAYHTLLKATAVFLKDPNPELINELLKPRDDDKSILDVVMAQGFLEESWGNIADPQTAYGQMDPQATQIRFEKALQSILPPVEEKTFTRVLLSLIDKYAHRWSRDTENLFELLSLLIPHAEKIPEKVLIGLQRIDEGYDGPKLLDLALSRPQVEISKQTLLTAILDKPVLKKLFERMQREEVMQYLDEKDPNWSLVDDIPNEKVKDVLENQNLPYSFDAEGLVQRQKDFLKIYDSMGSWGPDRASLEMRLQILQTYQSERKAYEYANYGGLRRFVSYIFSSVFGKS